MSCPHRNNWFPVFSVHTAPLGNVYPAKNFWEFDNDRTAFIIRNNDLFVAFYHWSFKFHEHLSVKLIFQFIYFSALKTNVHCDLGRLDVEDCVLMYQGSYRFLSQIRFCGIHPESILYTRCQHVSVRTHMKMYVVHDTNLYFSVVDNAHVYSSMLRTNSDSGKQNNSVAAHLIWAVFIPKDSFVVRMYRLNTHKYKCLLINITAPENKSLELFDGPGVKSRHVTFSASQNSKQNALFKTSTFQCVMFIYNQNTSLSYVAEDNSNLKVVAVFLHQGNSTIISYQNNMTNQSISIFRIETDVDLRLNVSHVGLHYKGDYNTDICSFAGLSVYEREREIKTLCMKANFQQEISWYKNDLNVFQDTYSSKNTMTLAMYDFLLYGQMNIKLKVNTTSCKPRQINVCEVTNTHNFLDVYFYMYLGHYGYEVNNTQCLILQLGYYTDKSVFESTSPSSSEKHLNRERCEADLKPLSKSKTKIKLNIRGFLRGKFSFLAHTSEPTIWFAENFPEMHCLFDQQFLCHCWVFLWWNL